MKCEYYFMYDSSVKSFWGDVRTPTGMHIYSIDSADEMIDMMESGDMQHIDDVEGLTEFLKHDKLIGRDDEVVLSGFNEIYIDATFMPII